MLAAVLALALSAAAAADQQRDEGDRALMRQLRQLTQEIRLLRAELKALRASRPATSAPAGPPKPASLRVEDDDPALGEAKAPVVVVEFTDFQCPYCARFHRQTFAALKRDYIDTGKIRYVVRDFPLSFHAEAEGAAVAANCAGRQGAYWNMADALFENTQRLEEELYLDLAVSLNLDLDSFKACLADPSLVAEVERDVAYGESMGVRGTPAFFIGRAEGDRVTSTTMLSGAQPLRRFARTIDGML